MRDRGRNALFKRLEKSVYQDLEAAAVLCKHRGHPLVEIAHWMQQMFQRDQSDLNALVRHFRLDPSRVAADLTGALESLPVDAAPAQGFAPQLDEMVRDASILAEELAGPTIRGAHLILAALQSRKLRTTLRQMSREFDKIDPDTLADSFESILGEPGAEPLEEAPPAASNAGASGAPLVSGRQQALGRFTTDLTDQAREGKLDPVVGRDNEIRQLVDVLMRRTKNNPILVGEAGVGKTSVVEGLAQKIVARDCPPALQEVSLKALDLGLLTAGASMKGEFEQRLRQVIEEVQSAPKPIILFIDEAHMLIGAGGQKGQGDAANLLKPELARGRLRTVAATTFAEYKQHFEEDPALVRRFEVIKVDEPDEDAAATMLRQVCHRFEAHHKVPIFDEAITSAIKLSRRYIPSRQLPDKAVGLIDTASARVAITWHATPGAIEDLRAQVTALETEQKSLAREVAVGADHNERLQAVRSSIASLRDQLTAIEARWRREKELVEEIATLRTDLFSKAGEESEGRKKDEKLTRLKSAETKLAELQGQSPLVLPGVDAQSIGAVVSDWTGIPIGRMMKDEVQAVLDLADTLQKRVVGQKHALKQIATRLQNSRVAGLDNPNKPIGVFMLAGPSGVGKTETALALAEALYGGEQNVITINMSEFQEQHTVASLKGAPPGYVGYGKGGVLTEAVRRKPYSVVLLDEVEKAHPDVHEIFFQVFDKGRMDDSEGRQIDFKNTLILLTSNVGTDLMMRLFHDPAEAVDLEKDSEQVVQALRKPMLEVFPPALLGRLSIIPYRPLSGEMLQAIIELQLSRIQKRLKAAQGTDLVIEESARQLIAARCNEADSGARRVEAVISQGMLPSISREFLGRMATGQNLTRVLISSENGDFRYQYT